MLNWLFALAVLALSSGLTIFLVLKKPEIRIGKIRVQTFFFGSAIGAAAFLASGLTSPGGALRSIIWENGFSPLGILVLFFSMVFISIFIDMCGFFDYCARLAVRMAGNDGRKLFFSLYAVVSLLTIFTSNDIIILTFTPFVYYFAKHAKIDPKPYLFAEFFAANTWSMMLFVGNPTNILVAEALGITFLDYLGKMLLPTLAAGVANMSVIYILFRKSISARIQKSDASPGDAIKDLPGAVFGVSLLFLCIAALSAAPYFRWEMWAVSVLFASALLIFVLARKNRARQIRKLAGRMPWEIMPFLIFSFIIVRTVSSYSLLGLAGLLPNFRSASAVFVYGIASTLAANLLNNIPMTVLFAYILQSVPENILLPAAYATIVGSNLGAMLTPIGALAGLMWMSLLKHGRIKISFREFSKYGAVVTAVTLACALGVLALMF